VSGLVLSLFPGIGLLDQAFEEEGFCIVRGPDLIWGGDVRRFYPPAGRFDGVIGGPPCQRHGGLGKVNIARWGDDSVMPDMIPEFVRCIEAARPDWFLMENVPGAPIPQPGRYLVSHRICDNRWVGGEQQRRRRFTFGVSDTWWDAQFPASEFSFHIQGEALEPVDRVATVISTGQNGKGGSRASIEAMARAQGIDPARFENSPFSTTELRRAIANGVPLPMGRAVARAVKFALTGQRNAA
jgi:DNA (cytosine-5)-methyltransferase 1